MQPDTRYSKQEEGKTKQSRTRAGGICYGIGVNILSALAFIIPAREASFTSFQFALGRYLSYGLLSLCIFLLFTRRQMQGSDRRTWFSALLFAATGNVGYYIFLVLGVQNVGASVTALINGTLPITIALYGNWKRREYPFSRLLLPIILLVMGLLVINLYTLGGRQDLPGTLEQRCLGILFASVAVALWTWYAVANTNFLRAHPDLSSANWSTMIGVGTLFLVLFALPLSQGSGAISFNLQTLLEPGSQLLPFVVGSLILGIGVSWGGTLLWNHALTALPVSLAGQLIVFEPITVLIYVALVKARLPDPFEFIGAALIIVGVVLGIRATRLA
ncbi:DMT family transporter [Ktedonosporobacter rubrisoli]|uniref:DMT family transporter n=1 Tax=Ktedonosporobacter rubrisoli TaxID=2509675 RepID=A0A4P6JKN2_KTERU|nr:DMT family transporter [Ktedonosporobacter rubrisoli]QBD75738.1 DMT family transporter [Ktedonosporobacter rubrisoli]